MKRLKGKKQIEQLFMTGNSVGAFPLRMVYLKTTIEHQSVFRLVRNILKVPWIEIELSVF